MYEGTEVPIFLYQIAASVLKDKIMNKAVLPSKTEHLYNIYTMLDQHRKRWANVV